MKRSLVALLLWCSFALLASPGAAEIYRWTDAEGRLHFSDQADDVPPDFRDQIADLDEMADGAKGFSIVPGLDLPVLPGEADGTAEPESSAMPDLGFDEQKAQEFMEQLEGPLIAFAVVVALTMLGFMLAFWAICVLMGCRLVGQESPGFKKAYGIVMVFFLAGVVVQPGVIVVMGQPAPDDLGAILKVQGVNMLVLWAVHAAVLRGMLCDGIGRSIALALVTNIVVFCVAFMLGFGLVCAAGGMAALA